jgi:hypothetical protein
MFLARPTSLIFIARPGGLIFIVRPERNTVFWADSLLKVVHKTPAT